MPYIETPEHVDDTWRQWEEDNKHRRYCDIADPTTIVLDIDDDDNVNIVEAHGRVLEITLLDPGIKGMETFLTRPRHLLGSPTMPPVVPLLPGRWHWNGNIGVLPTSDDVSDQDVIGESWHTGFLFTIVKTFLLVRVTSSGREGWTTP